MGLPGIFDRLSFSQTLAPTAYQGKNLVHSYGSIRRSIKGELFRRYRTNQVLGPGPMEY
jgi:hypothetical protein